MPQGNAQALGVPKSRIAGDPPRVPPRCEAVSHHVLAGLVRNGPVQYGVNPEPVLVAEVSTRHDEQQPGVVDRHGPAQFLREAVDFLL